MSTTKITPRIYVACLASYNAGKLHGRWIDATQCPDDIQAEVDAMLAESPEPDAEEWAIHDHEGLGDIGESESFVRVSAIGQAIDNAGDNAPALLAFMDYDSQNDPEDFEDCYAGEWDSLEDFAYDFHENTGDMDHPLIGYIDWDRVGRDMEVNNVWTADAPNGGVYVFWRR